ncbi:CTM1 [Candida pseudojiufengensis]|uniref:CTM1 n=1 Tax=Candida pseudojiufengensis TaxID=497109 RepID=UPI00222459AC|nr:CTM1 [Candida pseudojiufengensis]KAI5961873.1 CTM1 [Candida pseudojiufengensis]
MPIKIPKGTVIPGIENNEQFKVWVDANSHSNLTMDHSQLGGIGLFYESKEPIQDEEDPVILRVPSDSIVDLHKLFDMLEELKVRDRSQIDGQISESKVIVESIQSMVIRTETDILMAYIVALKILKSYRENSGQVKEYFNSPISKYNTYLNILSNTNVSNPHKDDILSMEHKVKENYIVKATIGFNYEEYITKMTDCFPQLNMKELMPFETYYQLHRAVMSRSLEIPRGLEEEEDSDDYVVDVSLVPILDFVNHNRSSNSYFDIDKDTNDVILKLKSNEVKKKVGKFEITITYDDLDYTTDFFIAYGFNMPYESEE